MIAVALAGLPRHLWPAEPYERPRAKPLDEEDLPEPRRRKWGDDNGPLDRAGAPVPRADKRR